MMSSSSQFFKNRKQTKKHIRPVWESSFPRNASRTLPKVNIVARETWGARSIKNNTLWITTPVTKIVRAYTDTDECTTIRECRKLLKNIQERHFQEGHADIKYNFVIGNDGNVYEGLGWKACPNLPDEHRQHHKTSLFVAICGRTKRLNPSQPTFRVWEDFINYAVGVKLIDKDFSRIWLTSS